MTEQVERLRKELTDRETEMREKMKNFKECKRSFDSAEKSLEDVERTVREQWLKHNLNKMLIRLAHKVEASRGWQEPEPEWVQAKLGLNSTEDVLRLNLAECMNVIFTLKSMKYEKNIYFRCLWELPPPGLTMCQWMELAGRSAKILYGHAPHSQYQSRICHYLKLPAPPKNDPLAPPKLDTLEDIQAASDQLEEEFELKKKQLKRKRKLMEHEQAAKKLRLEMEQEQKDFEKKNYEKAKSKTGKEDLDHTGKEDLDHTGKEDLDHNNDDDRN